MTWFIGNSNSPYLILIWRTNLLWYWFEYKKDLGIVSSARATLLLHWLRHICSFYSFIGNSNYDSMCFTQWNKLKPLNIDFHKVRCWLTQPWVFSELKMTVVLLLCVHLQVCEYFVEAVEKNQYGWFWFCVNGDESN